MLIPSNFHSSGAELWRLTILGLGEGASGKSAIDLVALNVLPLVFQHPTLPEIGDLAGPDSAPQELA